jgi:hypothetical protein
VLIQQSQNRISNLFVHLSSPACDLTILLRLASNAVDTTTLFIIDRVIPANSFRNAVSPSSLKSIPVKTMDGAD